MSTLDANLSSGFIKLAIEGQGLSFYYDSKKTVAGLNGLNINVEKGTIYGLLGSSGCGKTTLLRCVIGRIKPQEGILKVYGKTPGEVGSCVPGKGVGYMPQDLALYPEITIQETLVHFGSLYLMKTNELLERISFLLKFLEIKKKNALVKNLSGGEKRRVSFAAALIHQPHLLILDEPTVGVDPLLRRSIWDHLKHMAVVNQMTIIVTTHYVEEARQANMVGMMRDGHLLSEMNPERLIQLHGVQNLESVFWKLCKKETEIIQQQGSDPPTIPLDHSQSIKNGKTWMSLEKLRMIQMVDTSKIPNDGKETREHNGSRNYGVALLKDDNPDFETDYYQLSYMTKLKESQMRMLALIKKSFICLRRNIPFALCQVFVPAFHLIVLFLSLGHPPFDLPLAVVNHEIDGPFSYSRSFLNSLSNHTFKQKHYLNLSLALESVKNGKTRGAMYIGPRFTSALTDRFLEGDNAENSTIDASKIHLYLDMTNQPIALSVYSGIVQSFQTFAKKFLSSIYQNPRLADFPIALKNPIYGKSEPNFTEFVAPGMIIGVTYFVAVGLTALAIVTEKKAGLMDRSWIAGVSAAEFVFSIWISLFVTMVIQVMLVLLLTFLVFNLPFNGSLLWISVGFLLAGTCGMSHGLLVSAVCDNEITAALLSMSSLCPVLVVSGIMWPVEAMEYYIRHVSYFLPLTLLTDTMRSLLNRGWDITQHSVWTGCAVSATWTLSLFVLSCVVFKYKRS